LTQRSGRHCGLGMNAAAPTRSPTPLIPALHSCPPSNTHRREGITVENIVYAHVLGMDALALGLGNAAALKQSVLPPSLPPVHVSGIDALTHSPRSTALPTCSPGSLPSVPHCKPHRRESVDVEDIVYAHMFGMDALASGLRNAGCPIHSLLSSALLACVRSPPPPQA
jgi:hypothetical protein